MKRITLLLVSVLLYATSAWAQISVTPSTGVYREKNGTESPDEWAPIWKSNVTAADGSTPLLVMTAGTGINTSNGNIFPSNYTLEVPAGYVISSYTLNGTAAGGDVTITPSGKSATVISNNNSLSEALAVTVRAQSTSFALAGGRLTSVKLNVTVSPTPVIVAMNSANKLPSEYGGFSGQTFTTAAASGMDGVTITASSGLTINEATVTGGNYGKCFSLATAAKATNYTVTMTAPTGYVITGYYLGCSANTSNAPHILTSADGSVSVVASAPPSNKPEGPKVFQVTGLNTNSTHFTINTANSANTLYLPTFYITVAKASEVVDVTYNVMFNGSQVATATGCGIPGKAPTLPSSLMKDYCTYNYYSNAACTEEISTLTSETTTVYAKCTFSPPFTVSKTFNTATWYYAKIRTNKYIVYGDEAPYACTTTKEDGKKGMWAFMGDPYTGIQVVNRYAGSGKYLEATATQPSVTTTATNWTIGNNGGNFTLWAASVGYMNDAGNEGYLKYWNNGLGATDDGSTWRVEAAPSDAEALENLCASYEIESEYLDKPGFPTTEAYNTFRNTIEGFPSLEAWDEGIAAALEVVKASVVYPNGTYYIKNRHTGCYAFITDDGELVPRIKIDNSVSHANNNYLWTVTSDRSAGTCSIVSSLYSTVPFAKGDNTYSNITSSNRTVITTLSTELFSSNNGTTGAFYLNGAHNNNDYDSAGNGNSHVISWDYQNASGSQWIFEPVDLGTKYTVTVEGLNDGGQDAVTLSDGTIVNLGTGTVYLSETPTTSNITLNEIAGYSSSIVVDNDNHTITVTYSPYDVLIANYWEDNNIAAKLANAGQYGYPALVDQYTGALIGVQAALNSGTYPGNATNYNNLRTWYAGFLAADVILPPTGKLYRFKANATSQYMGFAGSGKQPMVAEGSAAIYFYTSGKQFVNYNSGRYLSGAVGNAATDIGTEGPAFNFYKSGYSTPTMGTVRIQVADNSKGSIIAGTDNLLNDGGDGNDALCEWVVEDVKELPVTISSAGYATLYAPVALTIPEGVTAYVATVDNGSYLHLEEISGGIIPANTGVILKGVADTYNFGITTGGSAEGNVLTGTVAAIARLSGSYILSNGANGVGFYKDGAQTIPGFKSYLAAKDAQGVRGFLGFNFDDPTAISVIEAAMNAGKTIYDLSGRRVENPVSGLYIVNGKKVFINKK